MTPDKYGRAFEQRVLHVADLYWKLKFAWIRKAHTERRYINKRWIETGAEGYDFYGTIFKGGQRMPVYIECKTTAKPSIRLMQRNEEGSGIKYHQLTTLIELKRCGADTFVLWEIRGKINTVVKLNVNMLERHIGVGHSYNFRQIDKGVIWTPAITRPQFDFMELLG